MFYISAVWIKHIVEMFLGQCCGYSWDETSSTDRQTQENCNTVAVKEKLGGLGKKRTSSKHLWRTNRDAKDSHLCLHNHLLSLSVSVSLALSLIHCSFFTYAPFVLHKIQAWQLRTLGPFGWNICSALAAFYKSAEPRWEQLKQKRMVALNKAPI